MSHIFKKYFIIYYVIFLSLFQIGYGNSTVKVAVVHFEPFYGEVDLNINRLAAIAEEAGNNGAKIIVFPELATSGYSYFSRHQIQKIADTIPGRTSEFFSEVAKKHEMYIVLGLAEYSVFTNQYYNSAFLINPQGEIEGVYRKHSHIVESSWSSSGKGKVPVFETIYGKLAILICADINYSELSIQTMLKHVNFLVLPTNGGINENLLRARAIEGNCHVILANRYGNEHSEYLNLDYKTSFNEDTFQIIPPFYYDFQDGKSIIINSNGKVCLTLDKKKDSIGYYELALQSNKSLPVRRPEFYSLLRQNTLDPYVVKCMKLPKASSFNVMTSSLKSRDMKSVLKEIEEIFLKVPVNDFQSLKLIVFPADALVLTLSEFDELISHLKEIAIKFQLDIVIGVNQTDDNYRSSILITKEGKDYCYNCLHKFEDEIIKVGDHFFVVDRDYGRLALLQGTDLLIPETIKVLAKMGVDLVAVSANMDDEKIKIFSKSRSLEYLHIAMSNLNGTNGVYLGGFQSYPPFMENDSFTLMEINTHHVRDKKELKIESNFLWVLENQKEKVL